MSIEYKEQEVVERKPVKKKCDKCGREWTNEGDDAFEWQEFHHIRFRGGYGSVFGDEVDVESDICQYCLYEAIWNICRATSYGEPVEFLPPEPLQSE